MIRPKSVLFSLGWTTVASAADAEICKNSEDLVVKVVKSLEDSKSLLRRANEAI